MLTQCPKGTKDIFGDESVKWQALEKIIRDLCRDFGFGEVRTPIFEHTELFLRGVGETTDIVQKEMYTFNDKGNRSITLKPETTAGAARAYVEHTLYSKPQPIKFFYIAPHFRYEKPQTGRLRQHHQFGAELYGSYSPAADAEVMTLVYEFLNRIGIKNSVLHVNSIGGRECRRKYNDALKTFLGENIDKLCPTCRERFDKNPLRVLDCKVESCRVILSDAPKTLDSLGGECREHFDKLIAILEEIGIPYVIDYKLVRGFDYYTRTVFEFISPDIGAQDALAGGGRYDHLVEECGGPATGCAGFGMGLERILLALDALGINIGESPGVTIYVGSVGEKGFLRAQSVVYGLRGKGISAENDVIGRSVKAQMKYADKIGAKYSVILGDDEIERGTAVLKNMSTGEQHSTEIDKFAEFINSL